MSFRAQAGTGTRMEWGLYVSLRSSNSLRVLTVREKETDSNKLLQQNNFKNALRE